MNPFRIFPRLLALLVAAVAGLAQATTVEVVGVLPGAALLRIDGSPPRKVNVGELLPQGVYLRSVDRGGEAKIRIRGAEETVSMGKTVISSLTATGLPSLAVPKNTDGQFLAQFTALNQPFQVELDPKNPITLLMPVADAERIRLPFKDEPAKAGEPKKKPQFPRPQRVFKKGKPYFNHFVEIKNVRAGTIELFGVKAVISEDPDLKRAVAGRGFLLLTDATWEGSTMTLQRLP
jgi:aspartyl protease family protein